MTANVEAVVAAAEDLSPTEQLEVIALLSQIHEHRYAHGPAPRLAEPSPSAIPLHVRRTRPVTDLNHLAADFWPEDETADDINAHIALTRSVDRESDMPDFDEDA